MSVKLCTCAISETPSPNLVRREQRPKSVSVCLFLRRSRELRHLNQLAIGSSRRSRGISFRCKSVRYAELLESVSIQNCLRFWCDVGRHMTTTEFANRAPRGSRQRLCRLDFIQKLPRGLDVVRNPIHRSSHRWNGDALASSVCDLAKLDDPRFNGTFEARETLANRNDIITSKAGLSTALPGG